MRIRENSNFHLSIFFLQFKYFFLFQIFFQRFIVPILRNIKLPNTSYGEDYAIGLRISREYKIGRIYDVIYLCRRWEGNSDAALSTEKVNRNNFYKDLIRTWEIKGRIQMHTIDEEFQELVEEI